MRLADLFKESRPERFKGTKAVSTRMVNAENSFINSVMEQFSFNKVDAEKIMAVYKQMKLIKIDVIGGQMELKDGRFWEKVPMKNAVKYYNENKLGK